MIRAGVVVATVILLAASQVTPAVEAVAGGNALLYAVVATFLANVVAVVTLLVNGMLARKRENDVADRLDKRAERDRLWLKEDRDMQRLHADTIAATVTDTARNLAVKVSEDSERNGRRQDAIAATVQATAATLAAKVAADSQHVTVTTQSLVEKVAAAEKIAMEALAELKRLVAENTQLTVTAVDRADAAYKEANHVNVKISNINSQLLKSVSAVTVIAPPDQKPDPA